MRNHPKRYLLEIQRFGSPGFGLKLSGQDPIRPHMYTQLQAKSCRAKPLNFHLKFLVPQYQPSSKMCVHSVCCNHAKCGLHI